MTDRTITLVGTVRPQPGTGILHPFPTPTIPHLDPFVFLDTGEQTFRRVTPAGDTLHLHCDNPAYPSTTLDITRRTCPISVLGRAVWCGGFLG